jgi:hypothetical protein
MSCFNHRKGGGMVTKRQRLLFTLVLTSLLVVPAALNAQSVSLGQAMGHLDDTKTESSITMFTYVLGGYTPLTVSYTGDQTREQWNNGTQTVDGANGNSEFKEHRQRLLVLGMQAGMRFDLPSRVSLSVSMGASYLQLRESTTPGDLVNPNSPYLEGGAFPHNDFYNYKPNPGFSASLGFNWEMVRFKRLSALLGLEFLYMSTYGLRGHSLSGTKSDFAGAQTLYEDVNTADLSLHLFTLQPHLGVEWRPFQSFITNNFGMFFTMMFSAGSETRDVNETRTTVAPNGTTTINAYTKNHMQIDVSMSPIQYIGAYYAWHVAIPHVGTLGAELQFGSVWNAILSYQYMF